MNFRRVGWVGAVALAVFFELSCGQVYRPVVIPINITPPNSSNFHAVFGISANVPFNPGTALQIDVSGDTDIGQANMGVNPTHAAILPNNSRVFVASAGSLFAGDGDLVSSFFPAGDSSTAAGLGNPIIFTLPNTGAGQSSSIVAISEASNLVTISLSSPLSTATVGAQISVSGVSIPGYTGTGYNGNFPISFVNGTTVQYVNAVTGLVPGSGGTATVPLICSYLPDFVATSQSTAAYVSNFGAEGGPNCNFSSTDSVAALNLSADIIGTIAYLPAASHPVAMVETPDGMNLYVLNQGTNTVMDLSPIDLSTIATIPFGNLPAWAVARPDSQRVYVITQGDGQLATIDTTSNTVISTQSVGGAGANYVLYDKSRNRLYVTNPTAASVYIFDATGSVPVPIGSGPIMVPTPSLPAKVAPCTTCSKVMPVSVAALPDGTRFYVASYITAAAGAACPDPNNVAAKGCVIPQVTVFDAGTLSVKTSIFPLLVPIVNPVSGVQPFATAPAAFCTPVSPYSPASARFRMSATASADSTRVYASLCDGGSVAIVNTTTSTLATGANNSSDVLVTDLAAPFSAGPAASNGEPPPQNPVFLLTGQ